MPNEDQIPRVRRICLALPGCMEKLSHGEPTFFVKKKVFAMISNNHHNDGHVAVWVPAPPGEQEALIEIAPKVYYRPPYVGVKGWVGIELSEIGDDELGAHLSEAWRQISVPTLIARVPSRKPRFKS
jgi:hypothetical protein